MDFLSPSNRARLAKAELYDTAQEVIRDKATALADSLYDDYLEPTTGHWLGAVQGHHWAECEGGETTDQRIMRKVGGKFLGTCAYIILDFLSEDASDRHGRVVLWVHHGRGNGKASAPITKLENLSTYWEADVFVIGHMSKLAAAPINRVYPKQDADGKFRLEHKKILLVGAGSWSKAYQQGHRRDGRPAGCYVEESMLNPAALGGSFIRIKAQWDARRWTPEITVEV